MVAYFEGDHVLYHRGLDKDSIPDDLKSLISRQDILSNDSRGVWETNL